jgi:hypothetical protein
MLRHFSTSWEDSSTPVHRWQKGFIIALLVLEVGSPKLEQIMGGCPEEEMPEVSELTTPCHSERSEESRPSHTLLRREIPRYAQNDRDTGAAFPGYFHSATALG